MRTVTEAEVYDLQPNELEKWTYTACFGFVLVNYLLLC